MSCEEKRSDPSKRPASCGTSTKSWKSSKSKKRRFRLRTRNRTISLSHSGRDQDPTVACSGLVPVEAVHRDHRRDSNVASSQAATSQKSSGGYRCAKSRRARKRRSRQKSAKAVQAASKIDTGDGLGSLGHEAALFASDFTSTPGQESSVDPAALGSSTEAPYPETLPESSCSSEVPPQGYASSVTHDPENPTSLHPTTVSAEETTLSRTKSDSVSSPLLLLQSLQRRTTKKICSVALRSRDYRRKARFLARLCYRGLR